jgi:hypothetical protein
MKMKGSIPFKACHRTHPTLPMGRPLNVHTSVLRVGKGLFCVRVAAAAYFDFRSFGVAARARKKRVLRCSLQALFTILRYPDSRTSPTAILSRHPRLSSAYLSKAILYMLFISMSLLFLFLFYFWFIWFLLLVLIHAEMKIFSGVLWGKKDGPSSLDPLKSFGSPPRTVLVQLRGLIPPLTPGSVSKHSIRLGSFRLVYIP